MDGYLPVEFEYSFSGENIKSPPDKTVDRTGRFRLILGLEYLAPSLLPLRIEKQFEKSTGRVIHLPGSIN